jgi:two-component system chemotaxis sensor kinase CheA
VTEKTYIEYFNEFLELLHSYLLDKRLKSNMLQSIHTVKGNSFFFHLNFIGDKLHEIETRIKDDQRVEHSEIETLRKLLADTLDKNKVLLAQDKEEKISFDKEQLKGFIFSKSSFNKLELVKFLLQRPASEYLLPYEALVFSLAERFNKKAQLVIHGGEILVLIDRYESLFAQFVHLIRNSIDHGIEYPEDRKIKGKPETGTISFKFERQNSVLRIEYGDDGQGANFEKIKIKAVEKNIKLGESPSKEELTKLMFMDGFSTKDAVDTISGLGMGLSSLQDAVTKLGGEIKYRSGVANDGFNLLLTFQEG